MDWLIPMAVSVVIQLIRDPKLSVKWRAALLKIFREIATQFRDDPDFARVLDKDFV